MIQASATGREKRLELGLDTQTQLALKKPYQRHTSQIYMYLYMQATSPVTCTLAALSQRKLVALYPRKEMNNVATSCAIHEVH